MRNKEVYKSHGLVGQFHLVQWAIAEGVYVRFKDSPLNPVSVGVRGPGGKC